MAYEKGNGKTAVIALGGNALGNTPQEQLELVQNTAKHIVDMIQDGTNVVVSHGNGPQVGMINNAFAYAAANDDKTPDMPFPEAGAMSQGYIGYQLSQAILNDLKSRDIMRSTACIVTQTVVDEDDPAFQNPTKPVGAFMDEETAKAKAEAMAAEGKGIADQRVAIARGIKDSIDTIRESGVTEEEANRLFEFTQWTDMMNNYAASGKATTVLLPEDFDQSGVFKSIVAGKKAGEK